MRRSFALALTALLLVFTLTACGRNTNNSTRPPSGSQSETSDTVQPGSNGSDSAINGSGSSGSDRDTTVGDAADDVMDGVEDAVDNVLPDDNANTRQRSTGGVSYGDMMHNDRR